jgi:hypothetical protein
MVVGSFVSSIGFWEFLEYFFESAVIAGCAGESLAEFTNFLNVRTEVVRKDRLQKISTIILLFGLAGALLSTIRTNVLAGRTIDELDQKAKQALADSITAVAKSSEAAKMSTSAESISKNAFSESEKAAGSASGALSSAAAARREAESLERDIKLAKEQATEAAKEVANASQRAHDATLLAQQEDALRRQLEARLADRVITPDQKQRIAEKVRAVKGLSADLVKIGDTPEINGIFNALRDALHNGHCSMNFFVPMGAEIVARGILVGVKPNSPKDIVDLANSLVAILSETLGRGVGTWDFDKLARPNTAGTFGSEGKPPAPDTSPLRIWIASK